MRNRRTYKPRCPRCRSSMMKRTQRSFFDKILNTVLLGVLSIRRYHCYNCLRHGIVTRFNTAY